MSEPKCGKCATQYYDAQTNSCVTFKRPPTELIAIWFVERFNKSPVDDRDYYEEWKERFSSGEKVAMNRMDSKGVKIWKHIRKRWDECY